MENIFFESKVMWSQIDSNNHLRHSAYADFGAQARLEVLSKFGFDSILLKKLNMGPIIFREELIYLREVSPADTVKVSCEMSSCRRDGSRWAFSQTIYKGNGVKAALINVEGAWMDIEKRKLTALPPEWALALMEIPKSIDFILEEVPEKKPDPIK